MRTAVLLLLLAVGSPAGASPVEPLDPAAMAALSAREADLLQRVRTFDPARHEQLLRLEAVDPRAYWLALQRVARLVDRAHAPPPELQAALLRLEDLKARHPAGLDALSADEQARVRAEITAIAERIFEIKQAERRRRIEQLRAALAELEADVERRDRERAALIERFVEDVLRGDADL